MDAMFVKKVQEIRLLRLLERRKTIKIGIRRVKNEVEEERASHVHVGQHVLGVKKQPKKAAELNGSAHF